jgi:hypothetical protein
MPVKILELNPPVKQFGLQQLPPAYLFDGLIGD